MGSAQDGDLGKNTLDLCNFNVWLVESVVDFTKKKKLLLKTRFSYAFILTAVHTCNRERRVF